MQLRALFVIDYQNVHLTAHDKFAPPGTPPHESLVHPLHFANEVVRARNFRARAARTAGRPAPGPAEVAAVDVFRGQPSNRHDPAAYRRSMMQKSEWTRDPKVTVNYRPLRYHWDRELDAYRKQEKGVDVLVALRVVRAAEEKNFDLVILASHDTDLIPALEDAHERGGILIETAGWKNAKRLGRDLGLWHTELDGSGLVHSRDRKDYT